VESADAEPESRRLAALCDEPSPALNQLNWLRRLKERIAAGDHTNLIFEPRITKTVDQKLPYKRRNVVS
jgi:hypothetical protein